MRKQPSRNRSHTLPKWPSNFTPGIKTKLKDFSGEIKKKIRRGRVIFHGGTKQKLCLKNAEIPWNVLLLWIKSKAQRKHLTI